MVMKMEPAMRLLFAAAVVLILPAVIAAQTSQTPIHGGDHIRLPLPPNVEKKPVTDNYFGTKITDDYRWLEDAKSAETRDFIDQQMAYTDRYLKQARIRPEISDNLDALIHVTSWTTPIQRGDNYFFLKRLSSEDQPSIYIRHGWTVTSAARQASKSPASKPGNAEIGKDIRLIDPAVLSRDPNTSVSLLDVSQDGSMLIYGVRQGGADEEEVHFFNVKTRKTLDDSLAAARYNSVDFAPDLSGVYYSRFTHQG
jgi:prolyl oligopeptidase